MPTAPLSVAGPRGENFTTPIAMGASRGFILLWILALTLPSASVRLEDYIPSRHSRGRQKAAGERSSSPFDQRATLFDSRPTSSLRGAQRGILQTVHAQHGRSKFAQCSRGTGWLGEHQRSGAGGGVGWLDGVDHEGCGGFEHSATLDEDVADRLDRGAGATGGRCPCPARPCRASRLRERSPRPGCRPREFVPALGADAASAQQRLLRVVTYNVLGEHHGLLKLHDHCPMALRVWEGPEGRQARVLDELRAYDADVICLQEVLAVPPQRGTTRRECATGGSGAEAGRAGAGDAADV